MKKKLLRIFASLAIVASVFVAAPVSPVPLVEEAAATGGTCSQLIGPNYSWAGQETSSPSYSRTHVQAFIDIGHNGTDFEECTPIPGIDFENNGPLAWVALVPRTGGTSTTILQIGVSECVDTGVSACTGTPRYFWAKGGCNGAHPTPQDLGPADTSRHPFVIYRAVSPFGDVYFRLQVNGGPDGWGGYTGAYVDISINDSAISCWASNNRKALWSGERWDNSDNLGNNVSGQRLFFDTMAFKDTSGSSWKSPNMTTGADCNGVISEADLFCEAQSSNSIAAWSTE